MCVCVCYVLSVCVCVCVCVHVFVCLFVHDLMGLNSILRRLPNFLVFLVS